MSRSILITGATRGLGRALVDGLIPMGHRVAGCGRSPQAVRALQAAYPAPHEFAVVDVGEAPQVEAWAQHLSSDWGTPELIVNNAGIIHRNAPLWELEADEFDAVMRVNVSGTANVIRAFLPSLKQAGQGVVVNMSSGWGRSTAPEVGAYCASKWAIEGLSRALAQELPRGLSVVALNPGVIDTDMLRSCWAESAAGFPRPEAWAQRAIPCLLGLGEAHNGESLSV